jgi:hypothetical protein
VVLSKVEHAALVNASNARTQKRKPTTTKKPTKAAQWASRFLRVGLDDIKRDCPPSVKAMFSKSVAENLGTELPNIAPPSATSGKPRGRPRKSNGTPYKSKNFDMDMAKDCVLVERILFLHRYEAVSVVHMLLMIFFFIQTYSSYVHRVFFPCLVMYLCRRCWHDQMYTSDGTNVCWPEIETGSPRTILCF